MSLWAIAALAYLTTIVVLAGHGVRRVRRTSRVALVLRLLRRRRARAVVARLVRRRVRRRHPYVAAGWARVRRAGGAAF